MYRKPRLFEDFKKNLRPAAISDSLGSSGRFYTQSLETPLIGRAPKQDS